MPLAAEAAPSIEAPAPPALDKAAIPAAPEFSRPAEVNPRSHAQDRAEPQPDPQSPASAPGAISVHYAYSTNLATNPIGGLVPGSASYVDNHRLSFTLPLPLSSSLLATPQLVIEAYDRNGVDLSKTAIGNQFTVQQLYGVETLAFYSLRLEAQLPQLAGRLKLGRFTSGDDFATWPIYYLAMSNAIDGNPQSLPVNTGFSSFPNAVWGGMAELAVGGSSSLQLGAYQVTDPRVVRDHGFNWRIHRGDGVLLISQLETCQGCREVGWQSLRQSPLSQDLQRLVAQEPSYPLHDQRLALGGYWSLRQQEGFAGADPAPSSYGGWLHVDRTLWRSRPGGPALTLWGSFSSSPQPAVAQMPIFWALGLVHYGLQPSRPQDSAMLAVYQGRFSPDYMRSLRAPQVDGAQETVIELGYRRHLGRGAFVQPNLQLVIHPSGLSIPTALVVGLQAGVMF